MALWKVVVTSLPLICPGDFINSPWKKQVRTIQGSVHHSDHLNGCACQWAPPAVQNTFQSLMEKVLVGLTWKCTIPYLDDCIILSRTIEGHLERLCEVFQRFKDANLKINPSKCEFFGQKVPFLGHIVSREGTKERYRSQKLLRPLLIL